MIPITELQRDALAEMFNIGVGRAASSLSQIVNDEILITAPEVHLLDPASATRMVVGEKSRKCSTVSQTFTGPFVARAVLVFPENNALEIIRLMVGEHITLEELSELEQEAMSEVGNIILNATFSAVADMVGVELQGSLPNHRFGDARALLLEDCNEESVILVIQANLVISKQQIEGHIVFVLSVRSLHNLLEAVDRFLTGEGIA